jgi:hypothetical protein
MYEEAFLHTTSQVVLLLRIAVATRALALPLASDSSLLDFSLLDSLVPRRIHPQTFRSEWGSLASFLSATSSNLFSHNPLNTNRVNHEKVEALRTLVQQWQQSLPQWLGQLPCSVLDIQQGIASIWKQATDTIPLTVEAKESSPLPARSAWLALFQEAWQRFHAWQAPMPRLAIQQTLESRLQRVLAVSDTLTLTPEATLDELTALLESLDSRVQAPNHPSQCVPLSEAMGMMFPLVPNNGAGNEALWVLPTLSPTTEEVLQQSAEVFTAWLEALPMLREPCQLTLVLDATLKQALLLWIQRYTAEPTTTNMSEDALTPHHQRRQWAAHLQEALQTASALTESTDLQSEAQEASLASDTEATPTPAKVPWLRWATSMRSDASQSVGLTPEAFEQMQTSLPALVSTEPLRLSISGLEEYLACPRKYFYSRRLRPHIEKTQASLRGRLIHLILEAFYSEHAHHAPQVEQKAQQLLAWHQRVCDAPQSLPQPWQSHETVQALLALPSVQQRMVAQQCYEALSNFTHDSFFAEQWQSVALEVPLEAVAHPVFPQVLWQGAIDFIGQTTSGEWVLADFKHFSSHRLNEQTPTALRKLESVLTLPSTLPWQPSGVLTPQAYGAGVKPLFQLPLYPLLFAQQHPQHPPMDRVELVIVRAPSDPTTAKTHGSRTLTLTVPEAEAYQQWLHEVNHYIVQPLLKDATFEANPHASHCDYCDYAFICDARTNDEESGEDDT